MEKSGNNIIFDFSNNKFNKNSENIASNTSKKIGNRIIREINKQ
jgi:hypothetical protein